MQGPYDGAGSPLFGTRYRCADQVQDRQHPSWLAERGLREVEADLGEF